MLIGLYDADGHNFPNLPLMKISAYHKAKGDLVEFVTPLLHYDRVYVSRVFGDEYTDFNDIAFNADEVFYGGTGFAIKVVDGKEVFEKNSDPDLPPEIEHIYPDYSLYPELTKDTAYGFLTRGCPNNCGFCIISQKEGRQSCKVADLSEFWNGQKHIVLLDANLLACRDRIDLLKQLAQSGAKVDFSQGLDARFVNDEVCFWLSKIKIDCVHFAFDLMENTAAIIKGLTLFRKSSALRDRSTIVYILTNYGTSFYEDWFRVNEVRKIGLMPDIRIYRKSTAPRIVRDLQRWCNNRFIYRSCDFWDYVPRADGKKIKDIYTNEYEQCK